jgi:DNA-binding SARP family transcriptional activator
MLIVSLFGKFSIESDQQIRCEVPGGKARELFCYLMLHRHQPHAREALAALLWPERETAKSKKSLRQVLWQLQLALHPAFKENKPHALSINPQSIFMDGDEALRVDVDLFEKAYRAVHDGAGKKLDAQGFQAAQMAVDLYRGDLLEGCYQDWCLVERERLQNCYLFLLDRLIDHCQETADYRLGIDYGERVLRLDRAHERTHRHLMRLHYQSGDRTAALRQFERCKAALREELGVEPAYPTKKLHEELRTEHAQTELEPSAPAPLIVPTGLLYQLQHLLSVINRVGIEVRKEIQTVKQTGLEDSSQVKPPGRNSA